MDANALLAGADASIMQGRAAPKIAAKPASMAAARKSAQDFESFFASQVLEQMFSGVKTDSMFGGGHGEEIFRSLLLDAYGKQIATHSGFGIADSIMRTLTSQQEIAPAATQQGATQQGALS